MFRQPLPLRTMPNEEPPHISIQANLPRPETMPPPEAANFFSFSHAGFDIQMLVGYIDPRMVEEIRKAGGEGSLTPTITHRFALSPTGFSILRGQLDEMGKKYDANVPKLRDALSG